jgi:hypothetical protein
MHQSAILSADALPAPDRNGFAETEVAVLDLLDPLLHPRMTGRQTMICGKLTELCRTRAADHLAKRDCYYQPQVSWTGALPGCGR